MKKNAARVIVGYEVFNLLIVCLIVFVLSGYVSSASRLDLVMSGLFLTGILIALINIILDRHLSKLKSSRLKKVSLIIASVSYLVIGVFILLYFFFLFVEDWWNHIGSW